MTYDFSISVNVRQQLQERINILTWNDFNPFYRKMAII